MGNSRFAAAAYTRPVCPLACCTSRDGPRYVSPASYCSFQDQQWVWATHNVEQPVGATGHGKHFAAIVCSPLIHAADHQACQCTHERTHRAG